MECIEASAELFGLWRGLCWHMISMRDTFAREIVS
jgi:hypothetical protein